MGINLSGGMAAGQGADALESLLTRLFAEGQAKIRNRQVQQGIDQEGERLKMAAADRAAAQADLSKSRAIQNAGRIAGNLRMGQSVSPETIDALKAGDLGDLVQHEQENLASRAITAAPITGTLRMGEMKAGAPERDTFLGTAEQHESQQAQQERQAARAEGWAAKKQAQEDAQQAAREMQRQRAEDQQNLARVTAGLRGGNADLQRELLQGKIDAARDKATEKQQAADTARNAALASIDDTASALDELIDANGQLKPGVGGTFGWDALRSRIPGTSAADAKARLDRLQSRLTVDLLGEMKRQSRTGASGFGALSEKELAVLQNAAARLGTSQSDESARQALLDVRKQLAGMRQRAAGPSKVVAPPGGGAATETPEQRIQRLLGGGG